MAQQGLSTLSVRLDDVFLPSAISPLAGKSVNWQALLALLVGITCGFVALRIGSRVLREFGVDACWSKREPLLPVLARRSDAPRR